MSRWWPIINRTAIIIAAVAIAVFAGESIVTIANGQIVVGWTYWGAPVFAILQLVVAIVAAPALLLYACRHWNDRSPPRSSDQ